MVVVVMVVTAVLGGGDGRCEGGGGEGGVGERSAAVGSGGGALSCTHIAHHMVSMCKWAGQGRVFERRARTCKTMTRPSDEGRTDDRMVAGEARRRCPDLPG